MASRNALTALILAIVLAACSGQEQAADSSVTAAPAETAPAEVVADEPALEPGEAAAGSTAPAEADTATPAEVPAQAARPLGEPTAVPGLAIGRDYDIIRGGQPFSTSSGIEVAEVFAYWCGACAQFEPLINAWKARLPTDVTFIHVPAVFNEQDNFPRAFYATQAMGIFDKTHPAIFRAIHIERSLPQNASADAIATFLARHGTTAQEARSTMDSFAVNANLGRARQFAIRSGVQATPTLIVNGRYRVASAQFERQLEVANLLIAHERANAAQ